MDVLAEVHDAAELDRALASALRIGSDPRRQGSDALPDLGCPRDHAVGRRRGDDRGGRLDRWSRGIAGGRVVDVGSLVRSTATGGGKKEEDGKAA